jgi:alpha-tubulin suppressor-like RCC1 family protein
MLDRSGNLHQVIRTTNRDDVIEEGLGELYEGGDY